jgi:hypothetical protein
MKHFMDRKNLARIVGLAVAAIVLAAAFWMGGQAWQARAQTGTSGTGSGAPNALDAGPFKCTIANIAVFDSRIHVHCTTSISGTSISYFAAPGDNLHAVTTNRFLMLLNTAYSLGKPVYIYYYDSTAQNPTGCGTGDCRGIYWMFIVP